MKNIFKTLICIVMIMILTLAAVACNNTPSGDNPPSEEYVRPSDVNTDNSFVPTGKILVAYFSKTNTTKTVADEISRYIGADVFEIERKEPSMLTRPLRK